MPTCAVVNCSNGSGRNEKTHEDGTKATLFQVPPTEGLQKQWEEQINRKDFKVKQNTIVCSLHFEADAFVDEDLNHDKRNRKRKRKKLKPRAIPTLHLRPQKPEIETDRDKRSQGRKTKFSNDVTVIPKKYLKLSHLAEHSYAPFVEDTSDKENSSKPANVENSFENPKPSTSHEDYEMLMVNNEDLAAISDQPITDFGSIEDCKYFFCHYTCTLLVALKVT